MQSSSPKPKKHHKKRKSKGVNSSSSSSSDSSDAGEDVDEILKKSATYKPSQFAPYTCGRGCNCESFSKVEVKKNITSKELHLMLVYIGKAFASQSLTNYWSLLSFHRQHGQGTYGPDK